MGAEDGAEDAGEEVNVIHLAIPWPPSNNVYWRHLANGRTLLSAQGKTYCNAVWSVWLQHRQPHIQAPCKVTIEAYFPNEIRRDLDNLPKAIMDSLTKVGVWSDDSLVEDLRIVRRRPNVPGGQIKIEIDEI